MKRTTVFPLLLLALVMAGCSTMGKRECVNADWRLVGFGDGTQGRPLSRLDDHRRACARVDVVPDQQQYRIGHAEGVREYCTAHRGYTEGVRGATYHGVCPDDLDREFRRAYNDGRELHAVTSALAAVNSTLSGYYARIDVIEKDIAERERAIVSDTSTADSRREHLDNIRSLREELSGIHDAMFAAEYDRNRLEEELEALYNYHRRLGYR